MIRMVSENISGAETILKLMPGANWLKHTAAFNPVLYVD